MSEDAAFDYIIVGAGSAGCVLANRLSEDLTVTVLLLEAGPKDRNPLIHLPAGFAQTLKDPKVNWLYQTEPEAGTNNRTIVWPRGKVLGGSSSINGLLYIRGQTQDYDHWAQLGNRGWSWDDVAPYFRKSVDHASPGDLHGAGGPLAVSEAPDRHLISDAFIAAGEAIGIPRRDDLNGLDQEGIGYYHLTARNGLRVSAAKAYLKPIRIRPNLKIETDALASRIVFDGTRADAVEYVRGGQARRVRARREILLCGGAVNSPQLLQLSGVGPANLLREHGIAVIRDAPGVGENLQDHYVIGCAYRSTQRITINELSRGLPLLREVVKWVASRRGLLAMSAAHIGAFVKTRAELSSPDVQYHILPASMTQNIAAGKMELDSFPGMTCAPCQLRPESRGSIHIKSARPTDYPAIRPNYLSARTDQQTVVESLKIARRIFNAPPLDAYRGAELEPGADVQSDDELLSFARERGNTIYHPVGTCKMGSDPMAVVDAQLRVYGVQNLRVIDASIMPNLISGNTNAPVIMIAEKAADMIRMASS